MADFLGSLPDRARRRVLPRMRSGPPVQTILAAAPHFDLIVMGTHGRTGLPHVIMGSVAESVVRASPRPVLTVRQPDRASATRASA